MIAPPTAAEAERLGRALGLAALPAPAEEVARLLALYVEAFAAVAAAAATHLAPPTASAARAPAWRPAPADNPCNAWAFRTDIKQAESGALAGYSVALKDTIMLEGVPFSNGSAAFGTPVADMDATVVTRILQAGGTILGKAQCEDFCVSGGSHTSCFGPVENPRRAGHSAGGSSSGCGALVALGAVDMAIGGDQGGSIRIPAAYCGINGMKPSWGLVPYTGVASIETSLDHLGPMTRGVVDNARLLGVIAGDDGQDPRRAPPGLPPADYLARIADGVRGLRIGVLAEGFAWAETEPGVRDSARAAVARLVSAGAIAEEISIPLHAEGRAFNVPIEVEGFFAQIFRANGLGTLARAPYSASLLAAQGGLPARLGEAHGLVQLALLAGAHAEPASRGRYYAMAQALGRRLAAAYDAALGRFDALVMPTLPQVAPPLPPVGAGLTAAFQAAGAMVCNTAQFDVTGHPALSTPCGLVDGLPVGLMLVGKMHDEATLYRIAHALESARPWAEC